MTIVQLKKIPTDKKEIEKLERQFYEALGYKRVGDVYCWSSPRISQVLDKGIGPITRTFDIKRAAVELNDEKATEISRRINMVLCGVDRQVPIPDRIERREISSLFHAATFVQQTPPIVDLCRMFKDWVLTKEQIESSLQNVRTLRSILPAIEAQLEALLAKSKMNGGTLAVGSDVRFSREDIIHGYSNPERAGHETVAAIRDVERDRTASSRETYVRIAQKSWKSKLWKSIHDLARRFFGRKANADEQS